jgi:DNA-binding beta-propeller fold protein YncE
VFADGGSVTTIAGRGSLGDVDGLGTVAAFYHPMGISVRDSTGVVYVADYQNKKIRAIAPGTANLNALQMMAPDEFSMICYCTDCRFPQVFHIFPSISI